MGGGTWHKMERVKTGTPHPAICIRGLYDFGGTQSKYYCAQYTGGLVENFER
jgi:hypothetical protein